MLIALKLKKKVSSLVLAVRFRTWFQKKKYKLFLMER